MDTREIVADLLERPVDEIDDIEIEMLHVRALSSAKTWLGSVSDMTGEPDRFADVEADRIWSAIRQSYGGGLGQFGTDIALEGFVP